MANTVWNGSDKTASCTLTGSNLIATSASAGTNGVRSVDKQIAGKFYWECTYNVNAAAGTAAGGMSSTAAFTSSIAVGSAPTGSFGLSHLGSVYVDGVVALTGFGTIANGTVVCIAVDTDARLVWFRLGAAGNWNTVASNNPATGVGGVAISLGRGIPLYPACSLTASADQITANFGDTAFVGAVPSGYTSGFTATSNQWNPSDLTTTTLSNGNLTATSTGTAGYVRAIDTKAAGSGKFYWEVFITTWTGANTGLGFCPVGLASPSGATAAGLCAVFRSGNIYVNGTNTGTSLGIGSNLSDYAVALDTTAKLVWFRRAAGSWNNSGTADPATSTGGISVSSVLSSDACPLLTFGASGEVIAGNFSGPFLRVVPNGYYPGWPIGADIPTNALASQALAEHWLTTDPQAQTTQVLVEHWQSVASGNLQAVVTQVLIEHWMSVASVVPAAGGPQVTMIH